MRIYKLMCLVALLLALGAGELRAEPGCYLRTMAAEDGSPSGMDDCQLATRLEQADLRRHLLTCAQQAAEAQTRVYGTILFQLNLHPGGGLSHLRLPRSAFDRTGLPACIRQVLQRRLAGPTSGKAAALMGRFSLTAGAEDRFGFSLSGQLVPKKKRLPPLDGKFVHREDGLVTRCGLAGGQLVLRLDPRGGTEPRSWESAGESPAPVQACLALAEAQNGNGGRKPNGQRPRNGRSLKRQVTSCLVDLLADPSWQVKAAAAEELASGWRWRGRRAIKAAVIESIRGKACLEKEKEAGKDKKRQRQDETGIVAPADEACPIHLPPGAEAGHALVRMVKAHLRLRRSPGEGVLDGLAAHPEPLVRLRLLDTILARWYSGVPEGLARLIHDPDPEVRGRAQQIGCLRGDYDSMNAFRSDLRSADPRTRAQAVLLARSCAQHSTKAIAEVAAQEQNPALALLILLSAPTPAGTVLLERAGPGLFDPCPLVRYLAGKLLFRLREVPSGLIATALDREVDPILRQQLHQLSGEDRDRAPIQRSEQIWFQARQGGGPDRP